MRTWKVSKIWDGGTAFIIGGGPSLKSVPLDMLRGRKVIAVNDSFKLGPDWIDFLWFSDCRWYKWNEEALKEYRGLILGCPPCHCDHKRVLQVKRKDVAGISSDPNYVHWNKNSGTSAINLAYLLGASRVVLLGFDMQPIEGQNNWHSNHKFVTRPVIYTQNFLPCFAKVAEDAKRLNLEILNATEKSAIIDFRIVKLEEVLDGTA